LCTFDFTALMGLIGAVERKSRCDIGRRGASRSRPDVKRPVKIYGDDDVAEIEEQRVNAGCEPGHGYR
jgi:hypothetical protein